ncbi:hypothetical protein PanWU01x14_216830, partial [Parasponia andersonii]
AYLDSKTLAEKEILSLGNKNESQSEVVSLVCGLVGGDALLPFTPATLVVFVSQLTNNEIHYNSLKYLGIAWKSTNCTHR